MGWHKEEEDPICEGARCGKPSADVMIGGIVVPATPIVDQKPLHE